MSQIYFISGSCGVGKSTIMPYLQKILPQNKYRVFDFDQRGVPENADKNWRISESKYWTNVGLELAKENINTIICGFVKIADLPMGVESILLDIEPEILRQRLTKRYGKDGIINQSQIIIGKPINDFIESNIYILEQMRKTFQEKNCAIIDTSNLSPEEVAKLVVKSLHR